jgi:hypothetical protein
MTTEVAIQQNQPTGLATFDPGAIMERVMVMGDLAKLKPEERTTYYMQVCQSLNLNPLTRPFEYIELDGKLTLYARRDATDQLRAIHRVNIAIVAREKMDDVYIVTARATLPNGRTDEATGVVVLVKEDGEWKTAQSGKKYFQGNGQFKQLRGDSLANALMRAETKAKRRVTLSICGLGWIVEDELDTVSIRPVQVDTTTGEIIDQPSASQLTQKQSDPKPDLRPKLIQDLKTLRGHARAMGIKAVPSIQSGGDATAQDLEACIEATRKLMLTRLDELQQWADTAEVALTALPTAPGRLSGVQIAYFAQEWEKALNEHAPDEQPAESEPVPA